MTVESYLVLLGDLALSTGQYPDDPGMAVTGRSVEGGVPVLQGKRLVIKNIPRTYINKIGIFTFFVHLQGLYRSKE